MPGQLRVYLALVVNGGASLEAGRMVSKVISKKCPWTVGLKLEQTWKNDSQTSESPGRFIKTQIAAPTPSVSNLIGLGWSQ